MSAIYVYGDKPDQAAELVFFARTVGDECYVIACGCDDPAAYAQTGADRVIYLGGGMAEGYASAIAKLLKERNADLFAATMSCTGRELGARVAGYLDCAMVSGAMSISKADEGFNSERMMYGGSCISSAGFSGIGVATIAGGKYPAASGVAEIENVEVEADNRVSVIGSEPIVREGVDITAAEKVVGAGMGFSSREELELAYELAAALGAEVGCTRSLAEDQHWFSEYIGLSGVQISPKLYVALGISGQVQHSVGVRGSQVIVAINRDEKAPIMSGCDYAVVGDMYELVPMLTKVLKAQQ